MMVISVIYSFFPKKPHSSSSSSSFWVTSLHFPKKSYISFASSFLQYELPSFS
jgi:hypothetical protein